MTGAHNRPPTSGSAARPNPRVPRRRSYVIWDKRNEEDLKLITPLLIFPPKTSLSAKCTFTLPAWVAKLLSFRAGHSAAQ